ncbi:hypothetical protein HOLleu_06897 [Holothuria leucospilota]|uniref:Uncharacterized protein n=1 Tax=Holothuria leucospilota TaxID=206669 RepID=A0A9Q1CLX4_HOLLE|nr:hypothetical protein HOLleu_06897 [Holothuria leucospilota]
MLSIKVEPEDIPTWEEERRITQKGYTRHSENAGGCASPTAELTSSDLEGNCENGVKKEDTSHTLQERGIGGSPLQVITHIADGNHFLRGKSENENAVVIKIEDSSHADEGMYILH